MLQVGEQGEPYVLLEVPRGLVVECGWLTCNISGNPTPNGSFDGRPVKHWARLMPQLQGRQIFLTQAPRDNVGQGLSVLSVVLSAPLLWMDEILHHSSLK